MPYPAKTIAKAKLHYSQGKSYREISEKTGIHEKTLEGWGQKGEWVRGNLVGKIAQRQELSLLQKADEIGLTEELLLNEIKELVLAENIAVPAGNGFSQIPLSSTKNINPQTGKYEFMGVAEELEVVPDRKSRIEGMKLATDIRKMRDKDINLVLPEPFIIKNSSGKVIERIESKRK